MNTNVKTFALTASAFQWTVSEGKTITAWGFNHSIAPELRVKKGDTVVVKVKNELAEPTIVHWHGIRLTSNMDGTGDVQNPIAPGEVFEYRFVAPDAGTYWFHSHHNETVQMERGMYGALIVEDDNDPVFDNDRVFVLDDMKLTGDGRFREGGFFARWAERHDGREGETVLVNGREKPIVAMFAGQTERWRFINASSARYVRLFLGGKSFTLIGADGGLIEHPVEMNEILIVPGERVDLAVGPFAEGDSFAIESLPYNRRTFVKSRRVQFAQIQVGEARQSAAFLPQRLRLIDTLASADAAATRKVKLSVAPSLARGIDFHVNNAMHAEDKPVYVGDLQVWEVSNTSLMDHPFHLHGFFFQVLDVNGSAPRFRAWKDTVNVPPKSTVKIAWIADNRPGNWMYHCHIIEHHEAGMMAHFQVVDRNASARHAAIAHNSCKMTHHATLH